MEGGVAVAVRRWGRAVQNNSMYDSYDMYDLICAQRPAPLSPLGSWGASVEPLLPYRTWYNATLYGKEGQEGPWEMRRWGRQGLGRDGEMRS
ncbi:hypothetical protein O988_04663 [Pseudogymnoascus sp. VKM F-3808]|nr:hypothetical protein O988_04663 [Pseudogymnoascus sp. VKM F-3808]